MYYLTLENDFINTLRYVELDEVNFKAYSIEFTKQYQSICSEIDVLCKEFCHLIDSVNSVENMREYTEILLNTYSEIIDKEVKIKNRLILMPWKDWKKSPDYHSPDWWSKYNKVKHNRTSTDRAGDVFFKQGNMGNVLNSLTGLFVLEM